MSFGTLGDPRSTSTLSDDNLLAKVSSLLPTAKDRRSFARTDVQNARASVESMKSDIFEFRSETAEINSNGNAACHQGVLFLLLDDGVHEYDARTLYDVRHRVIPVPTGVTSIRVIHDTLYMFGERPMLFKSDIVDHAASDPVAVEWPDSFHMDKYRILEGSDGREFYDWEPGTLEDYPVRGGWMDVILSQHFGEIRTCAWEVGSNKLPKLFIKRSQVFNTPRVCDVSYSGNVIVQDSSNLYVYKGEGMRKYTVTVPPQYASIREAKWINDTLFFVKFVAYDHRGFLETTGYIQRENNVVEHKINTDVWKCIVCDKEGTIFLFRKSQLHKMDKSAWEFRAARL